MSVTIPVSYDGVLYGTLTPTEPFEIHTDTPTGKEKVFKYLASPAFEGEKPQTFFTRSAAEFYLWAIGERVRSVQQRTHSLAHD